MLLSKKNYMKKKNILKNNHRHGGVIILKKLSDAILFTSTYLLKFLVASGKKGRHRGHSHQFLYNFHAPLETAVMGSLQAVMAFSNAPQLHCNFLTVYWVW